MRPGRVAQAWRWVPEVSTFGLATSVAMLTGALLALAQAELPASAWLWISLGSAGVVWLGGTRARPLAAAIVGFSLTSLYGIAAMQARLPEALQGTDLVLTGRVDSLPLSVPGQVRFDFVVDAGENEAAILAGRRVRLSWYRPQAVPAPGSLWRLQVRLKRPRGSVNPGGFDFERHALERRLAATGYVRDAPGNAELARGGGVDALRLRLSDAIAVAVGNRTGRFVQALSVGDTRGLDERDWEVLRATGITHLIAISGLHVGLVAGFGALLMA
jgi:competence protein ComEC